MTDYKNLKLIASSSPHIRSNEDTRSIMLDVIIAMVPALVAAIYFFGFRALTVTAVSVAACVFFEWLYCKIMKRPQPIGDLSAVVTGMLLAFTCPVSIPYWMIVIGDAFAIIADMRAKKINIQCRTCSKAFVCIHQCSTFQVEVLTVMSL